MSVDDAECKLRAANGAPGIPCDAEECVFWRAVEHLGVEARSDGCAIQHFQLLDGGEDVAAWLLSVKDRLESGS